jgi:hypothetical protein
MACEQKMADFHFASVYEKGSLLKILLTLRGKRTICTYV